MASGTPGSTSAVSAYARAISPDRAADAFTPPSPTSSAASSSEEKDSVYPQPTSANAMSASLTVRSMTPSVGSPSMTRLSSDAA